VNTDKEVFAANLIIERERDEKIFISPKKSVSICGFFLGSEGF